MSPNLATEPMMPAPSFLATCSPPNEILIPLLNLSFPDQFVHVSNRNNLFEGYTSGILGINNLAALALVAEFRTALSHGRSVGFGSGDCWFIFVGRGKAV